ncbi:hypothetical protein BCV70DRAFT_200822 [Testicularia cyperi]|uniref:Uncharacterized protein n=1 Tax=Testicularia cyperi TaxID=1882483 RepID=A0A317XP85_9BASI|nr:hypothetical protein BCV70DRAFT_200822 [Testicularia cyperi]
MIRSGKGHADNTAKPPNPVPSQSEPCTAVQPVVTQRWPGCRVQDEGTAHRKEAPKGVDRQAGAGRPEIHYQRTVHARLRLHSGGESVTVRLQIPRRRQHRASTAVGALLCLAITSVRRVALVIVSAC